MAEKAPRAKTPAAPSDAANHFPPFPPDGLLGLGRTRRIIVVGAGLSGLAAAHWLSSAGHEVTILEASDRIGGRVLTLRTGLSKGCWVDAGATFIPGHHTYATGFARQLGLPLMEIEPPAGEHRLFIRNTSLTAPVAPESLPLQLTPWESSTDSIDSWFGHYTRRSIDCLTDVADFRRADWASSPVRDLDRMTVAELLRTEGASPGAIEVMRRGPRDIWGEGVHDCSALLLLRDAFMTWRPLAGGSPLYHLSAGMDAFPEALADSMRDRATFRLSAPATDILQSGRTATVRVRRGSATDTMEADFVLCTVPPGPIAAIRFEPDLAPDQRQALRSIGSTSVVRVFVEFDEPFWRSDGLSGAASTDLPGPPLGDPEWPGLWVAQPPAAARWKLNGEAGVLEVYLTSESSRRVARMNDRSRLDFIVDQLEKVFPGARSHFTGRAVAKCWDADPWCLGAYPSFRPGHLTDLGEVVQRPHGRIHFAGDHTSVVPGWMQGALESGIRAAHQIHMER